jgi:hypothetical protein
MQSTVIETAARLGVWGAVGLVGLAAPAAFGGPITLGFAPVPGDTSGAAGVGQGQLSVQVRDGGSPGKACLEFQNTGTKPVTVTGIFVQGKPWLLNPNVTNGPGTSFQHDATPATFPTGAMGGAVLDVSASFSTVPDHTLAPGSAGNASPGLDPGEKVQTCFDIAAGMTFLDVAHAVSGGGVRIGVVTTAGGGGTGALLDVHTSCKADLDGGGSVKITDALLFLEMYQNANPVVDLNGDGNVNVQDFMTFLSLYSAGCPTNNTVPPTTHP